MLVLSILYTACGVGSHPNSGGASDGEAPATSTDETMTSTGTTKGQDTADTATGDGSVTIVWACDYARDADWPTEVDVGVIDLGGPPPDIYVWAHVADGYNAVVLGKTAWTLMKDLDFSSEGRLVLPCEYFDGHSNYEDVWYEGYVVDEYRITVR